MRRHTVQQDLSFAQEIDKADGMNQDYFWRLINRKRGNKSGVVNPFQNPDGTVLTDVAEIRSAWAEYYENVYSAKDNGYSQTFREHVESVIDGVDYSPQSDSVTLRIPVSRKEVDKIVKKLKRKKATGPDRIQAEHVKMGGPSMLTIITDLINAMITKEHRPPSMKRGLIVPIPKGRKDCSIPDNNRGITLTSVIGKIYDSVLVARVDGWFQEVIDDLQGARHNNCSCTHTSLLLREAIAHSNEKGHGVYTALLDVRKAFDQVWIKGLFYKL